MTIKRLGWVLAAALPLLGGRALANDEKDEGHAHEAVKMEELLRKETRHGKVIYEGEIVKAGKGVDLEVGSDGKVVLRGKTHDESKEHERGER
jgi:hypothetical protein